ncbi:MAG: hypothetical protein IJI07_11910 [Flexilinea sp.]|nr:hypothetical protein [Flexilinea sp.]
MKDFKFFTQISTSHSSEESLNVRTLRERLDEVRKIIPISGLIAGSYENKAVFQELTAGKRADDPETYLWYNLLSDYPGQDESESVITDRGKTCQKWFGWGEDAQDEVSESFMFSCPNHPGAREKTLNALSGLLDRYPFDGVFLDKFRFPSPASGLDLVFSCFCPHCCRKAAEAGLDLEEVKRELRTWDARAFGISERTDDWLEALLSEKPLLKQFLRFRIDSVLEIVREVRKITDAHGVKLGFDLFSPSFAEIVGYDYRELAQYTDWVKPMTYQYAFGPAGLRLETIDLVEGIGKEFGLTEGDLFAGAGKAVPWFTAEKYAELKETAVPMEWIRSEMAASKRLMEKTPVYFGLECVSFPGVIDVQPDQAAALLTAALDNGADGTVLSWDLMHMPPENLKAMRSVYDERCC